jgi:type IV pilus assembly protein PilE
MSLITHRFRPAGLRVGRADPGAAAPEGGRGAPPASGGFTLMEAMIVTAIIAILAAIALPSYTTYVRRSHILEAVARLADARARMEEFFQDERTYVDASGGCGAAPNAPAPPDAFVITCSATAATFTYTATGKGARGMSAFVYSIDEGGAKATVSVPSGWQRTADCWTIRADGSCV